MKRITLFLFSLTLITGLKAQGNVSSNNANDDFRNQMLNAVNSLRAKGFMCGDEYMPPVPKVKWNDQLEGVAIKHAKDMKINNYFSHTSLDGKEIDARVTEAGYKWSFVSENIAKGDFTIASVMRGWEKSHGHCVQLMSPEVIEMGVAQYNNYWVMDFGKPLK